MIFYDLFSTRIFPKGHDAVIQGFERRKADGLRPSLSGIGGRSAGRTIIERRKRDECFG